MAPAETIEADGQIGVRFEAGGKMVEIVFGTTGEASGRIRIAENGKTIVDKNLTRRVTPQVGLAE